MISLKRSVEDYADTRSQAVGTLCLVLEALRQYVVETDPAAVEQFRVHLAHTIDRLQVCVDTPDKQLLKEIPTDVGGELRDYRDHASQYIDQLRGALKETAEALSGITQLLQADDTDAHLRLTNTIGELHGLLSMESLVDVRAGLRLTTGRLTECADQLRRERDGVVVQLRDEIRSLQKSVEQAERATTVDPVTGVYKREEFQKLVLRDIVAEREASIIHVWLRNLQELRSSHSDGAINELLAEFCKRVGNIVPAEAVVGRWCSDVFCVLVRSELARRISTDLMRGCVGRYLSMADGSASTINMDGVATCVKLQPHESAEALFEKIDKLHFSLSR